MIRNRCLNLLIGLALMGLLVPALPASARDLQAVADGQHLWIVVDDPDATQDDGPGRLIYHTHDDAEPGELLKLDPLKGKLMKRGVAAGDGRLLMITEDRQVTTIRPIWSDLLKRYLFSKRDLPTLPDGCAVVSVAVGPRGPWALVRVEDPAVLKTIEPAPQVEDEDFKIRRRNLALGLPEDFGLNRQPTEDNGETQEPAGDQTPDADADADAAAAAESETASEVEPVEPDDAVEPAETTGATPVLRLIKLHAGKWVASPLPEALPDIRHAELVMGGDDDQPTLIIEPKQPEAQSRPAKSADLIRYSPAPHTDDPQAPRWIKQAVQPSPAAGQLWSATTVNGQVVIASERRRSIALIDIDALLIRGSSAIPIGELAMNTQGGARWSIMPWQGALAVVASPGPRVTDADKQANPNQPVAVLSALTLNGKAVTATDGGEALVLLREPAKAADEGELDLYIQIGTFAITMMLLVSIWGNGKLTKPGQIDLPDELVLASFGRRFMAGFIDLTPGFLFAGALYDTTVNETMWYWPGNGVPKVLSAMMPGFTVIVITVLHTTVAEALTARSLGKWLAGLYVTDLSGKPAGPMPCTIRSLSRVFDLLAPLIIVVAIISPARQRLGDILARTTVVMDKPEPIELEDDDQ